ncbi:MAG: MFS transporter, partial [Prevotella sp.]|nr:MFS transporter [Prevotella sp.]
MQPSDIKQTTARHGAGLTYRRYLVPFVLITVLFFLWGFARAILDVLNRHFQDSFNISIYKSAFVQAITYLAYFLMALPAGMFINRFGYRRGVVFGLVLFGVGALLFLPGGYLPGNLVFASFLIALFVLGCGLTFLETAANPYATELGPTSTATSRLNLSQTFNGLGSCLAPAVVGGYLFSGGDVTYPYLILGVVVLLIAIVFSRVKLPEIKHSRSAGEEPDVVAGNRYRMVWRHKIFVFGLVALLVYEVAEISINS